MQWKCQLSGFSSADDVVGDWVFTLQTIVWLSSMRSAQFRNIKLLVFELSVVLK